MLDKGAEKEGGGDEMDRHKTEKIIGQTDVTAGGNGGKCSQNKERGEKR